MVSALILHAVNYYPVPKTSTKTSTALGRTHNKDAVQRRFTLEVQDNFEQYTDMEVVVSWHFLLWQCYRHNGCGCIGSALCPKKKMEGKFSWLFFKHLLASDLKWDALKQLS